MQYADMCLKYALNVISMKKTPSLVMLNETVMYSFDFY